MKPSPLLFAVHRRPWLRSVLTALAVSALMACAAPRPKPAAEPPGYIEIAPGHFGFRDSASKAPFVPVGVNYDHDWQGRLLEDYWDGEWPTIEGDFAEIAALGFNTVRLHLQFARFMRGPDEADSHALANLDKLVALAGRLGLRLDLTGLAFYRRTAAPSWYRALDDEAMQQAQAAFWRAIAARFADEPAIFCFDLQNEPTITVEDTREIVGAPFADGYHYVNLVGRDVSAQWARWIRDRYGNEARLRRHWPNFPLPGESFDRPALPTPLDRERQADLVDFAHERARQWTRRLAAAIRAYDQRHLITIGMTSWSLPFDDIYSFFAPQVVGPELDFISLHLHLAGPDERRAQDEALLALRGAWIGKPLVLEEMSFLTSPDAREAFLDRAAHGASGFFGYYWGRTPQELRSDRSIKAAVARDSLERFTRLAATWRAAPPRRSAAQERLTASIKALRLSREERETVKARFAAAVAAGNDVDVELTP